MSGRIWENERKRVYFLQRWPSTTSVKRVKQRVKELTPGAACHRDLRETIAKINPVIRGWGNYFATGNASTKFNQVDSYVWMRLRKLDAQAQRTEPTSRRNESRGRDTPSTSSGSTNCSEPSATPATHNCRALNDHR